MKLLSVHSFIDLILFWGRPLLVHHESFDFWAIHSIATSHSAQGERLPRHRGPVGRRPRPPGPENLRYNGPPLAHHWLAIGARVVGLKALQDPVLIILLS